MAREQRTSSSRLFRTSARRSALSYARKRVVQLVVRFGRFLRLGVRLARLASPGLNGKGLSIENTMAELGFRVGLLLSRSWKRIVPRFADAIWAAIGRSRNVFTAVGSHRDWHWSLDTKPQFRSCERCFNLAGFYLACWIGKLAAFPLQMVNVVDHSSRDVDCDHYHFLYT